MSKTGVIEYKKLKPMKTDTIWIEESDSSGGYEGYFLKFRAYFTLYMSSFIPLRLEAC